MKCYSLSVAHPTERPERAKPSLGIKFETELKNSRKIDLKAIRMRFSIQPCSQRKISVGQTAEEPNCFTTWKFRKKFFFENS